MNVIIGLTFLLFAMLLLSDTHGDHLENRPLAALDELFGHRLWRRYGQKTFGSNRNYSTFNQGKCLLCKVLVKHGLKKIKTSENVTSVLNVVEKMCVLLRLEPSQVCKGGIETFGKQVSLVLKHVDLSAEDVCYLAFPDRCSVSVLGVSPSRGWKVELPKPSTASRRSCPSSGKTTKIMKVLHLTDIHVDFLYNLEGTVQCKKPVCCRLEVSSDQRQGQDGRGSWSSRALSIMSKFVPSRGSKRRQESGVGQWGDYRRCDLPLWTMENMFSTIVNGSKGNVSSGNIDVGRIDFIILTGDLASHDVWSQSKKGQLSMLEKLHAVIQEHFPDTKIFPSPGNHDSYPPNNYPPTDVESLKDLSDPWIYDALAKLWSNWLSEEALQTVKRGAYYTVLVHPGFRIVSLNTNFCYAENWWIYLNPEDPAGMLDWFVQVLTRAEKAGEKVHVIGHVPPGRSPDCLQTWSENYYRILERFRCTITGQFFGHTHFDEVQVFYGDDHWRPIAVSYIAPSVTPYVDMNPAFRVYDVSVSQESSWRVVNHHTYIMDLEEVNRSGVPKWKVEYDALSAFNLHSLEPEEWGKLVSSWKNYFEEGAVGDPPETLSKYLTFYSRRRLKDSAGGASPGIISHNANLPCESIKCAVKVICSVIKNYKWNMCAI